MCIWSKMYLSNLSADFQMNKVIRSVDMKLKHADTHSTGSNRSKQFVCFWVNICQIFSFWNICRDKKKPESFLKQYASPTWCIKLYDSHRKDVKPQCNMTGNTPPCEVRLMPLEAWQGISLPPPPPLPQHVLTPNDIREGAPWRGHEFEGFAVWKRSWSRSE